MKTKQLLFLSLLALVSFAPHVLAQGFVPLAPITGLTDSATLNMTSTFSPDTLANFFNNLYKYLIGLAATLAVIEIIWGGLEISTKDSVSKQSDGKERIQQAIFGLVLVLSPVLVFSIINPSILNLSLNLPPIDLKVAPAPAAAPPPCIAGNTVNCTPQAPTNIGASPTAPTGQYCFERKNQNAATDFVCASTQAVCDKLYNDNVKFGDQSAVSSCILR